MKHDLKNKYQLYCFLKIYFKNFRFFFLLFEQHRFTIYKSQEICMVSIRLCFVRIPVEIQDHKSSLCKFFSKSLCASLCFIQTVFQEEDLGVPWSGVAGDPGVQYGGMFYPSMPGQQMHHPMGAPVIVLYPYNP